MAPEKPNEDSQTMDLRLIPEFDGVSQPVEKWLEKLVLVCSYEELQRFTPSSLFVLSQALSLSTSNSTAKIRQTSRK